MGKNAVIPPEIESYVWAHTRQSDLQRKLAAETAPMAKAVMMSAPDVAALLAMLIKITDARKVIEVGVFTGMSGLVMASALPAGGRIIACDISEEWTAIARRYWAEAGVADKIDLRLAPAGQTLDALIAAGESETFDLAFIDADKTGYAAYYEQCLTLLRPGGLIALDNLIWHGQVVDPADSEPDTIALRAIAARIRDDARVDCVLMTVGDGVMLARKR